MINKANLEMELLEIFMQLDVFLEQVELRNLHLRTKHIEVYVRRSVRAFTGELDSMLSGRNCLDIGDINVHPDYQGHGVFRRFIEYATQVSPYRFLLIECVLNDIIVGYAERHGWQVWEVNSYWKEIRK